MQPLSGNQRPDLLTSLMNMSLVLRLPRKMHLCWSSSNVPRLPSFLEMLQKPRVFAHFWQGAQSLAPATRNDIWTSKSGPNMWCFIVFLTCWLRNVLRATIACTFFDISTSKSAPNPSVFYTFDLEMCFAPQRRALVRHRNFQKCSDAEVFCTFWLGNVLRATTTCTFSTSQLLKVLRSWGALYILTSKCASRHNGVQFFISHLASWLRTRRFSEPTFQPSGATNHWKNAVFRDFPTFSRTWIFFLLRLSLFWSSFFFSSLLFSDSSHLCFSSVHTVGSLTLNFLRTLVSETSRKVVVETCNRQLWRAHAKQENTMPSPMLKAGVGGYVKPI